MLQTRIKLFVEYFALFLALLLLLFLVYKSISNNKSETKLQQEISDDTPQPILDMFKDTGCADYETVAKEYYKKIQTIFSRDVVNSIIKGEALPTDITTKQAMVASEFMNKYCGFNVDNNFPFCCTYQFPNSQFTSCTPCNVVNNTLCDAIGKDYCDVSSTKFGIDFCKLDNDKCVYNKDPTYLISNSNNCDNTNKACIYSNKNNNTIAAVS